MIILDTNVLSETLRPTPSATVLAWMRSEPALALFATAITEAGLLYGIAPLPNGRRRRSLEEVVDQIFTQDLADRVLPFDRAAAHEFARPAAGRRCAGRPISEADARIAAIARSRGAALAIRNVGDFMGCGLELINPGFEPIWKRRSYRRRRLVPVVFSLPAIRIESRTAVHQGGRPGGGVTESRERRQTIGRLEISPGIGV